MKFRVPMLVALFASVLLTPRVHAAAPRTIAFQGVLTNAARAPLPDGTYPSVTFRLYDHLTGPAQLWSETRSVVVAGGHGVFSTSLGSVTALPGSVAFDQPYWLSVQVGADPEMAPRLPLQSVPYALNAWSIGGNAGTNPATSFLGTTDSQPLLLKANNHRVLLLQDVMNAAGTVRSANVILGSEANSITAGVVGSTIGGGGGTAANGIAGDFGFIGGGNGNSVDAFPGAVVGGGGGNAAQGAYSVIGGGSGNNTQGDYTTIAGGWQNYVLGRNATVAGGYINQSTGDSASVGGGRSNVASGEASVVAGGSLNLAPDLLCAVAGGQSNVSGGFESFIGGGNLNHITAANGSIGGGDRNTILATAGVTNSGAFSAIGGGASNAIAGDRAFVGGGQENQVVQGSIYGAIGGGYQNLVQGNSSTVPGGYANHADADYSFAAGYRAIADTKGTFVWSDASADTGFFAEAPNQFCIRAAGGMLLEMGGSAYIYTGAGSVELNRYLELFNAPGRPSASGLKTGGILCADDYGFANPDKNSLIVKNAEAIGANSSGGRALYVNGTAGGTTGWNNTSDARLKTNVSTIESALDIVGKLRGVTFDWRRDTGLRVPEGRQVGFVAQEVEKVLPSVVATDDQGYKSVAYANVVPVLVEAIKQQQKEIEALRARAALVDDLEARLKRLEAAGRSTRDGR